MSEMTQITEPAETAAEPAEMTLEHCRELLRVERGNPDPEELAALAALFFAHFSAMEARAEAARVMIPRQRRSASWRRTDRATGFDGPRTWRAGGPVLA
ncbi:MULTISPECIES: acyl-CoA carboxylase epsilon subunit [Streptomyces]|uniref:Acyl-CoA carboxylase subunit epsilon n=1 Tax=Streptomyces crystallinus TaxID=68191 RepID=A0ABN1EXC2_9ACTN|nr:acyl-CoA carboxylase epsilon subunit [Streptomyces sp. ERV7]